MRLPIVLLVFPMALAGAQVRSAVKPARGVPIPLLGYSVSQPLGTANGWSASVADAGHGDVCLIARESGRVWSVRDRFVWQLASHAG